MSTLVIFSELKNQLCSLTCMCMRLPEPLVAVSVVLGRRYGAEGGGREGTEHLGCLVSCSGYGGLLAAFIALSLNN